jgi:hypothetical protein
MAQYWSREQYIAWAAQARRRARAATTEVARMVHLRIAREHEARVGNAIPAARLLGHN